MQGLKWFNNRLGLFLGLGCLLLRLSFCIHNNRCFQFPIHFCFHYFAGDFAGHIADFPFQIPDTRFACVELNQLRNSRVSPFDIGIGKACGIALFGNQEFLRDFHFLELCIPGKANHFHTILQCGRNGVQHIGSGYEEHFA